MCTRSKLNPFYALCYTRILARPSHARRTDGKEQYFLGVVPPGRHEGSRRAGCDMATPNHDSFAWPAACVAFCNGMRSEGKIYTKMSRR